MRLIIYEGSRTTIIPRRVPYSGGGKTIPSNSERKYDFRLTDGEIASEAVQSIFKRFNRPIATAISPNNASVSAEPLFEIQVYHKHRTGGESGMLQIYAEQIVFETEAENHSRYWRYSDIRDIGRLDRYKFEIATFEKRFGVDGKSYIFKLKRPITEKEYEEIWKRLYDRGRR